MNESEDKNLRYIQECFSINTSTQILTEIEKFIDSHPSISKQKRNVLVKHLQTYDSIVWSYRKAQIAFSNKKEFIHQEIGLWLINGGSYKSLDKEFSDYCHLSSSSNQIQINALKKLHRKRDHLYYRFWAIFDKTLDRFFQDLGDLIQESQNMINFEHAFNNLYAQVVVEIASEENSRDQNIAQDSPEAVPAYPLQHDQDNPDSPIPSCSSRHPSLLRTNGIDAASPKLK